eukprot:SAG31_NODE_2406_length_5762_cov_6.711107_7_plen_162_part_00
MSLPGLSLCWHSQPRLLSCRVHRCFVALSDVWDHYFATIGRGTAFILNMPPDVTGQIPEYMVKETTAFGMALRATMDAPVATLSNLVTNCSDPIIFELPASSTFDMIQTREDMLVGGQRIAKYGIDAWSDGAWKPFAQTKTCPPSRHPSPDCVLNKVCAAD